MQNMQDMIEHTGAANLIGSLGRLLDSGRYSDVIVRCGSDVYKLHRAVLCPRSTFFAAACDGNFREAHNGEIVLVDDDPSTVRRMMVYLYTLNYAGKYHSRPRSSTEADQTNDSDESIHASDEPRSLESAESSEPKQIQQRIINDVAVYALADKYGIEALKELAIAKFSVLMRMHWPHPDLLAIMTAVYENTAPNDDGLRSAMINICCARSRELMENPAIVSFMENYGDLPVCILKRAMWKLDNAEARLEELEGERQRHSQTRTVLEEADFNLRRSREEIASLEQRLQQANEQLEQANRQLEQVTHQRHQATQQLQQANANLAAMQESASREKAKTAEQESSIERQIAKAAQTDRCACCRRRFPSHAPVLERDGNAPGFALYLKCKCTFANKL